MSNAAKGRATAPLPPPTPGPWTAKRSPKFAVEWDVMAEGYYVAQTFEVGVQRDAEANARLIAAAPDLFAALRFLTEQINDRRNGHHTLAAFRLGAGMEMAWKALDKAEDKT